MRRILLLMGFILAFPLFVAVSMRAQQVSKKSVPTDANILHWNTTEVPLTFEGDTKPTDLTTVALFGEIECDDGGAIYVRKDTPGDTLKSPVVRVDTSQPSVTFDIPQAEFQGLDFYVFTFAVEPGGRVFELVRVPRDTSGESATYLLAFDKDGQFRRKTRLANDFLPSGLLALPDGNFLATGTLEDGNGRPQKAITAIFGSDGVLVKKIDNPYPSLNPNPKVLDLGHVRLGDDQDIYVLRPVDPPRVDVYNQAGSLIRSLKLRVPFEHAQSYDVYGSGYRVIVQYGHVTGKGEVPDGRPYFAVYNGETGELISGYSQMSRGITACIRNGEVTVLATNADKHFGILKTRLP